MVFKGRVPFVALYKLNFLDELNHTLPWISAFIEALLAATKFSTKNMRSFTVLLLLFVIVAVFIGQSQIEACVGHDGACTGDNGSQGNCCGGMLCQKNNPSWAEGRCYYRPG